MGGSQQPGVVSSGYPKYSSGPKAKQIHSIYRDRLRQFTDEGQYYQNGLMSKLNEDVARGAPYVKLSVWDAPGTSRPTFQDATAADKHYRSAQLGDAFGPSWTTHWFRVEVVVPPELRKRRHLELHWDADNEGMVWTKEGVPLQGLTGGGERVEWILPDSFRDGSKHTIYIEMACNAMFGNAVGDTNQPPQPDNYYQLRQADIVAVNLEARGLYMDFWEIGDAAREFPEDSWEEHEALQVCNRIMDAFIAGNGNNGSIIEGRKIASEYIGKKVDKAEVYDDSHPFLVNAIGNCHIDTCWLWPWAETKRKVARSWLNQCDLLERYPEYRFCASQAQQFKWLKTYYPSAFDRVKEKVKEGRFHPIGGSWVEHDTNMPSGESLVRQFLYGQRFFESHFGERCNTFWLPDTFGYSSQLPQLCRLAGMSRFFTQKLSWNNINDFPHTTFNWVSLDGSQVLCHMTPCNTYTAEADFGDVKRSVTQHKSMNESSRSLMCFGKGDGGGGPTWKHIEKLRRTRGMADTVGSIMPRLKLGESVDDFFARLETDSKEKGVDFVTWNGELYLELHRGCYTSQANNKRNNRRAEQLLHDLEFLATMASLSKVACTASEKYRYPKKEIDEMWENVLLCQFHDCLPGSAIEMCYDDSDELYEKVFTTGEKLLLDAASYLGLSAPTPSDSNDHLVAVNTLPFARHEIIKAPPRPGQPGFAYVSPYPESTSQCEASIGLCQVAPIPNFGLHSPPEFRASSVTLRFLSPGVFLFENAHYSMTLDNGAITSLYSRILDRELVPEGKKMNQLLLYDDKPLFWQAWDVETFHLRSRKEVHHLTSQVIEQGPMRAAVQTFWEISDKSWIKMTISMTGVPLAGEHVSPADVPAVPIEVSSEIEWREDKKFLKAEFPTTLTPLHNQFISETQFGLISRPTHRNTSWDAAKFEVVGHRFSAIHEARDGLAVLNDSKFGYAAESSTLRLSVLRAPKAPDGHADMGRHYCRWAILPFSNDSSSGGISKVVQAARAFNNPVALPMPNRIGRLEKSPISVTSPPTLDTAPTSTANDDLSKLSLNSTSDECQPLSNNNGHGNLGSPALFPFTSLSSYIFSTKSSRIAPLAQLLSSFTLHQKGEKNVVFDTIKRGEDDEDLYYDGSLFTPRRESSVILRLYEAVGSRGRAALRIGGGFEVKRAVICSLLEDEQDRLKVERKEGGGWEIPVELRAFEVLTVKVVV